MLKKIGTLLIIFVGFYMAGHYAMRWRNRIRYDVQKRDRMVECEANNVRSFEIEQVNAKDSTVLQFARVDRAEKGVPSSAALTQAKWSFLSPVAGEADPQMLTRLAYSVCEIYDPRPIREQDFKLSEARDGRAARVRFSVESGNEMQKHELTFGLVGQDGVALISHTDSKGKKTYYRSNTKLLELTSTPMNYFRNFRMVQMSLDNIQAIKVAIDGKERFELKRAGTEWKIADDKKELGVGSEEANKFVNRIGTLRAIDVINSTSDPTDCEKEPSKVQVQITGLAGKTESMKFSFADKSNNLKACNSAKAGKFLVHKDYWQYINLTPKKLM